MDLSSFIESALVDIGLGVHRAKARTYDFLAVVPGHLNGDRLVEKTYVDFDIAVTVSNEAVSQFGSDKNAGGGISIAGVNLGFGVAGTESDAKADAESSISRISFRVPIYLNAHFRNDEGAKHEAQYILGRSEISVD